MTDAEKVGKNGSVVLVFRTQNAGGSVSEKLCVSSQHRYTILKIVNFEHFLFFSPKTLFVDSRWKNNKVYI